MKKAFVLILVNMLFLSACEKNVENINTTNETQFDSTQKFESSTNVLSIEDFISETKDTSVNSFEIAKKREYEVIKLLSEFAVEPRRLEEEGHINAETFIINKLNEYGWMVTEKIFPVYRCDDFISEPYNLRKDNSEFMGNGVNIIAEQPNYDNDKPTLILSAHYDTSKNNIGIIDNGSGTAFLISAAEMLSRAELKFNIRLVFFDMEEYSMYGSKYYLENMSSEDRSRIIANINFDMIGGSQKYLKIATSNGLESALEIYLNDILKNKYGLSEKGMHSDSNAFMHWQIPAVTFIDESLPLERIENSTFTNLLSDEALNDILSDLVLIINNFDESAFNEIKNSNVETEYSDTKSLNSFTNIYGKIISLNNIGFKMTRCYSKVYDNGISSCLCCEYLNSAGQTFLIETFSEILTDKGVENLKGIPSFEDCKSDVRDDEILVDKMQNYKITGDLSDDELNVIWNYLRR